MRELVLDTETTGLDHENGDRIVEIGIVELENHIQTGNNFHYHINPERESDPKALEVHGLTREFLSRQPKFSDVVDEFVNFISDDMIIIHNAAFDVGFINFELNKCNLSNLNDNLIIDTLVLARKKFIGQSVSLDSLCRKFNIDISNRQIHGALKDAKLLSLVYLELIGGKQTKLDFVNEFDVSFKNENSNSTNIDEYYKDRILISKKRVNLNQSDNNLHLRSIKEIPENIWDKIKS